MDASLLSDLFAYLRTPFTCLLLAYGRWFVFASVFAAFSWAKINTGPIRSGIAFILAIPLAAHLLETQGTALRELPMGQLALLVFKEAIIGFMMGVLASLPIWVADICGGILAGIRQESSDEDKFGSSTFGSAFVLMAIGILVYDDGFLHVFSAVYASYEVWPVTAAMPLFSANAAAAFLSLLDVTFGAALSIAAPFILAWLLIDIWLGILGRSASRVDTGNTNELIKAALTVVMLYLLLQPIIASLGSTTHDMADLIGLFYSLVGGVQ